MRYEGRLRTIDAVREAGLETCVGGILNLGETREQRVEMAFELAEIDPTSVPINMLNPRPGTKFGDREYMDPWEAVKWIAIFRLILPEALFRLCGGRVENLGELQQLAVKAGINGVMMGNFLTTLGNEPETDRAMFEELGLNVARQPDNAANPRPDNRSGWLEGETPDVVEELLEAEAAPRAPVDLGRAPVGPLHPASLSAPSARCRRDPDGAPNTSPGRLSEPVDERDPERAGGAGAARTLSPAAPDQRTAGTDGAARRQARAAALLEQLSRPGRPSRACARRRPTRRCAGAWARGPRAWCRAR